MFIYIGLWGLCGDEKKTISKKSQKHKKIYAKIDWEDKNSWTNSGDTQ